MIDKPRVEKAIREILLAIGENPDREGLLETPERIAGMYEEIFSGISANPADVLKYFDEDYTEGMVIVKDIPFYSMCEHHILPFYGLCHVAYIPAPDKLLGISKLARLVDVSAKKLQLQEKMGREIADVLMNDAFALGAAVVIEAEHLCMAMRGIKKAGAKTVSTSFRGLLKTDQDLRQEALRLLQS